MTIDNSDDYIDSRDVIERIEELTAEREAIRDALEESPDSKELRASVIAWGNTDDAKELAALLALQEQADCSPDWIHGEQLIRRSYFVEYITQLIDDCYQLPKELTSGEWPYRHITIDFEAAAKEAEQDYIEVSFSGVDYLIRA